MKFYEIRNTKTQENGKALAKNFAQACELNGWRVKDCKCISISSVEGAW